MATHTLSDGTVVTVVHTLKNGTVVDDISKVTVPKEIGQKIVAVLLRYEEKNAKENGTVIMNK